jgi:hypothetical protein
MKDERGAAWASFHPSAFLLHPYSLLPLHLVELMRALAGAVLFELDLLSAAGDLDFGAVVEVAAARALQPNHFSILFGHWTTSETNG